MGLSDASPPSLIHGCSKLAIQIQKFQLDEKSTTHNPSKVLKKRKRILQERQSTMNSSYRNKGTVLLKRWLCYQYEPIIRNESWSLPYSIQLFTYWKSRFFVDRKKNKVNLSFHKEMSKIRIKFYIKFEIRCNFLSKALICVICEMCAYVVIILLSRVTTLSSSKTKNKRLQHT